MPDSRYATRTTVNPDKTQADIEKLLKQYGASQYAYAWDEDRNLVMIGFTIDCLPIRIFLPMPRMNENRFLWTATGRERSETAAEEAWSQECRSRWRAFKLVIQAKLEAIALGITTIEREFMEGIVLPNNQTFHDWAFPQIRKQLAEGKMPSILPGIEPKQIGP